MATIQSHMPEASNTTAFLLAQVAGFLSRSELRWELAKIAAAAALLSVAFVAMALFFFRRKTRDRNFVTAAYLFVDLEKSLLRYSAAGHPPLMLASRAARNVKEIEHNGLMLGMRPEAAYSSVEIRVSPGDRCLVYTDGLVEAGNAAQEEFGKSHRTEFPHTQRE